VGCVAVATLTLPGGYNWAEATRLPGALLMTAALVFLAVRTVRVRV
jgi:alpha-1,6-mannosyltransferase